MNSVREVGQRGRIGVRAGKSVSFSTRQLLGVVGLGVCVMQATPAFAINRSWDDAGNSASKLWSNNGNWSPDGAVAAGDDIFVGNLLNAAGDTTIYDIGSIGLGTLTISGTAGVDNNDNEIIVNGLTTVGGTSARLLLTQHSSGSAFDAFDTEGLTINSGGTVSMFDSRLELESGLLDLNAGGTLTGTGVIDFESTGAALETRISLDGVLSANTSPVFIGLAPAAGTLQLRVIGTNTANAIFDWDGSSGAGTINVNGNQTLDIDISTNSDDFDGTMNLNTGSTLDMSETWDLGTGTINVNTAAFGLIIIGDDPNPGAGASITNAPWRMQNASGTVEIGDSWDTLILDSQLTASAGTINNNGTIEFNGGATILSGTDFNMIGADASLIVNSAVNIDTPDFNLDGSGFSTNVTTINTGGNLDLDLGVGADEDFNHTINMNGGELDVTTDDNTWSLTASGNINAAGGVTSTINGEAFTNNGDIDVSASSTLNINATTTYESTTDVTIGAGSVLNNAFATYNGGNYSGAGVFKKGTATIATSTTWNVDTVDMDDGSTTINNGVTLTVNTDSIDDAGDGIDNAVTIANTGVLNINLSAGNVVFDNAGTITYNGDVAAGNFLQGSDIDMNGTMNINGDGRSLARLNIGGTVNLNDAGEGLRLGNSSVTNTIDGGIINGPGTLFGDNNRDLSGSGTINSDISFSGSSSELIATGGTLTVNGDILSGLGTLRANSGTLTLNSSLDSANTSNGISLSAGVINGSGVISLTDRNLRGNGSVQVQVSNNNTILSQGGTLTIANSSTDLDGFSGFGVIRADSGTLRLVDWNTADAFSGTAIIDAGATLQVQTAELVFDIGTLQFDGGTYKPNVTHNFAGTIVTNANSSIDTDLGAIFNFGNGSNSTIDHTLAITSGSDAQVLNGAVLSGGGDLRTDVGGDLNLATGSSVNVIVTNAGNTQIAGNAVGATTVGNFDQASTGTLHIDATGTGLSDFDRMTVTGSALLDGELDVDFSGFAPTAGDLFPFMTAGFLNGTFSSLDVSGLGAGLDAVVNYSGTSAVLEIINALILEGDYNSDGFVSQGDLDLVLLNWGDVVAPAGFDDAAVPGGGPFDGLMSQNELDGVLLNWGNGTPPALSAIPEPASAALVSLGLVALTRRRRQA